MSFRFLQHTRKLANVKIYALLMVFAVAVGTLLSPTGLAQKNRGLTPNADGQDLAANSAQQELQRAAKREAFKSGRDLLMARGVPFDPNTLLEDNWRSQLGTYLRQMPEMQQGRVGGDKLSGVQLADTLYLPEKVELTGNAVIIARKLYFDGPNALIKGPFDIHLFVIESSGTVADSTGRGDGLITIDTSGLGRDEWLNKKNAEIAKLITSGKGKASVKLAHRRAKPMPTDTSGAPGADGLDGANASTGSNGGDGGDGANGTCGAGNVNGAVGVNGNNGGTGGNGTSATGGAPGGHAGNITTSTGSSGSYSFIAHGGKGGNGGTGGNGGFGGNGGQGGDGGDGANCLCNNGGAGNGGKGGNGGNGGTGGNGGNGGAGANGGNGGIINITIPTNFTGNVTTDAAPGAAGSGGLPGTAGPPGSAGGGGDGGDRPSFPNCSTSTPVDGASGSGGSAGSPGATGTPGGVGTGGTPGTATVHTAGGCNYDSWEDCSIYGDPPLIWNWTQCQCITRPSPIIIDVNGDGFALTDGPGGVHFDLNPDRVAEKLSWTAAGSDDALLALDRNGNGAIDNGTELFGNFTPQPPSKTPNGFVALAVYDKPAHGGNGDGVINSLDKIYGSLLLWQDTNHNGISEASEIHSVRALGVSGIDLAFSNAPNLDAHGNLFKYQSRVKGTRGSGVGVWAWDVFFLPEEE
jgi:hypothetical protein